MESPPVPLTAPSRLGSFPWIRVATVLIALGLWQLAATLGRFPEWVLPPPSLVFERLLEMGRSGQLVRGVGMSMLRLVAGYLIAVVIGLPLGLALARYRMARETVGTFVLGMQALPSICWLPLALLWFGLSEAAILSVTVLGAALAITLSAESAVRNVPPVLIRAARTMGITGVRLQTRVVLPASLPELVSGARLAWTIAWRSLMAAELLFFNGGLGQLLTVGRDLNDLAMVLAVMGVIVALGLLVERVAFTPLQTTLAIRWGRHRA
ncbi:MAG: ABC transporter permease [Myxococcales bacterium]